MGRVQKLNLCTLVDNLLRVFFICPVVSDILYLQPKKVEPKSYYCNGFKLRCQTITVALWVEFDVDFDDIIGQSWYFRSKLVNQTD